MKILSLFLVTILISCQLDALEQEFFLELDMSWNFSLEDKMNVYNYNEDDSFLSGLGGGFGYRASFDFNVLKLGPSLSYHQKSEDLVRNTGASQDKFSAKFESSRLGLFLKLDLWQGIALYSEYHPVVSSKVKKLNSGSHSPLQIGDSISGTSSGYGFYMYWQNNVAVTAIYRKTIYKDMNLSGVKTSLPNQQYNRPSLDEFVVQMSYWF